VLSFVADAVLVLAPVTFIGELFFNGRPHRSEPRRFPTSNRRANSCRVRLLALGIVIWSLNGQPTEGNRLGKRVEAAVRLVSFAHPRLLPIQPKHLRLLAAHATSTWLGPDSFPHTLRGRRKP
jgi:hypothetical protein